MAVNTPSHLEVSFHNRKTASPPPTLLKWGIPQTQEGVSNAEQPKLRERERKKKKKRNPLRPMT